MKANLVSPHFIFLILFSCTQPKEDTSHLYTGPKVVETSGYIVPLDSMAEPKVRQVDESKLRKVAAGKPKAIPANTNIHTLGKPKIVRAGTPYIYTPGKDTFSVPIVVPAISKPFLAATPSTTIAKDPFIKSINPFSFSTYSKLQGLENKTIHSLLQDTHGNIWLGTNGSGVIKYDGISFTHFSDKGLMNNAVFDILEDKNGNIWFSSWDGGALRYDGKYFTGFSVETGMSDSVVLCILEDKKGHIWFGTRFRGVSVFDGSTFTHYTEGTGLPSNYIISLLEDRNGNIWIGTEEDGVVKFDGTSFYQFTTQQGLSNNTVNCMHEDSTGLLWFGTGNGLNTYDKTSFTQYRTTEGPSNNYISDILEDRKGNLWIATSRGGLHKLSDFLNEPILKSITHYTPNEGIPGNSIGDILEDNTGNLWVTTLSHGLTKYDGHVFQHYTTNDGLSSSEILSVLEDTKHNLWFGSLDGGVTKYDTKSFFHFKQEDGLYDSQIYTILEDKNEHIWFGNSNGYVTRFDGISFTHFQVVEGAVRNDVWTIAEDRIGNIWFGTNGGGALKYDGKTITQYSTAQGLSHPVVNDLLEDKQGNMWFSTLNGVCKYDGASFTILTYREGLPNKMVNCITEDNEGNIWMGTFGGGVCRYDGKSLITLTENDGLSHNEVWSIMEDSKENLWIGTSFGLSKLSNKKSEELSAKIKSNSLSGHEVFFTNYGYAEGFLGIGCEFNSMYEDESGVIWIGADDRLTAYHPEGDIPDTIPPNMQLNGISIFNELIPWPQLEIHQDSTLQLGNGVRIRNMEFDSTSRWYGLPQNLSLRHDNNNLTFNYIGITQKSPKKVKYRYQLEGNDEDWSSLTPMTEAHYGNLSHGHYTFKVKAMNSEGYWSDEFHYPFIIRPPWWLTWWAYSLYTLGMITLLWRLHKYQQARTIRIERERTQAKELEQAKEIEKAYTELKATQAQLIQSEKMASLGQLTAGIAHEIQNPLNFVNNFSDVNKELLSEMKEVMSKGNFSEAEEIANDVIANEEKINHHGKRADAIVKGMLQHSRSSSGVKEPTNINALADEYLRLAYHGLRAKDKTFNAIMKTDFDTSIGLVNVIPQDIGRVILNLITNAFYAVSEKAKSASLTPTEDKNYEPTVVVTTKKLPHTHSHPNSLWISVSDNGPGIPASALDKIFQPFFTTKPTGQGTGLGLSLSYDIIKAHGGELKVETKEGEGTTFIIRLSNA